MVLVLVVLLVLVLYGGFEVLYGGRHCAQASLRPATGLPLAGLASDRYDASLWVGPSGIWVTGSRVVIVPVLCFKGFVRFMAWGGAVVKLALKGSYGAKP